jgi:hypothetical protein
MLEFGKPSRQKINMQQQISTGVAGGVVHFQIC